MTLEQRIKNIIVTQLGIKSEEIEAETLFVTDLGADSLDLIELTMAVEEEFNIEIPDEDSEKITTVGKLIKYVQERTKLEKK